MYSVRAYIEDNYNDLCHRAKGLSSDPIDLVNHTYLRCLDKQAINPRSYFIASMWREAKQGDFKNNYTYRSEELVEVENSTDISEMIRKDRIDFHLLAFDEFDRLVWRIYNEGHNVRQVSKESGVSYRTIYWSIKKVKDHLKQEL